MNASRHDRALIIRYRIGLKWWMTWHALRKWMHVPLHAYYAGLIAGALVALSTAGLIVYVAEAIR